MGPVAAARCRQRLVSSTSWRPPCSPGVWPGTQSCSGHSGPRSARLQSAAGSQITRAVLMSALVLTIDTEPDLPKRRQSTHSTLRNIPELRTLQQRIPDIRLTLLVTQSVLDDADSLRELKRLNDEFNCEIGAHLHPEDTPPFVSAERRE